MWACRFGPARGGVIVYLPDNGRDANITKVYAKAELRQAGLNLPDDDL